MPNQSGILAEGLSNELPTKIIPAQVPPNTKVEDSFEQSRGFQTNQGGLFTKNAPSLFSTQPQSIGFVVNQNASQANLFGGPSLFEAQPQ